MRPRTASLLTAAALATSTPALADITYDVNVTAGTETITGTITTDGHLGTLSIGDLACATCSFDLTAAISGAGSFEFTNANSTDNLVGTGLSATATALSFNFTLPTQFEYRNPAASGPPGTNGICFLGQGGTICPSEGVYVKLGTTTATTSETDSSFLIGTAGTVGVPGPTVGTGMPGLAAILGLGGVLFAVNRLRRRTFVAYA
jgi:hypothetical protein